MSQSMRLPGKTTIAPEVLISIARLTTLGVEGVSRLATITSDFNRIFNIPENEGVKIEVIDGRVYADIFVVLKNDVNVREVSRAIQQQVARAISEMVGMDVGKVNIHVEDIDFAEAKTETA